MGAGTVPAMPALALLLLPAPLPVGAAFEEVATFRAPEAHQAVAVDAGHFYAIGNRVVAKYDKRTGEKVAEVRASEELPLIHMNGGVVTGGRLVVSHSNFPFMPATGSIESFSLDPLVHAHSVSLGPTAGSLTAALPSPDRNGAGTVLFVFAHYGLPRIPGYDTGTERTEIRVRVNGGPTGPGWVLPPAVVRRLRPHSVSGASFGPGEGRIGGSPKLHLWLSGHDRPEIYECDFPVAGSEMVLRAVHPAPIAGQGIAWDPAEPGVLWGTRRREGLVVKMRLP